MIYWEFNLYLGNKRFLNGAQKTHRADELTQREDERRKNLLPELRNFAATDITRAHIRDLLDAILRQGAGIEANQTHALLRKLFNWAVARDLVVHSPVAGRPPRPAKERRCEGDCGD